MQSQPEDEEINAFVSYPAGSLLLSGSLEKAENAVGSS